jgi:hypothetical protein
VPHVTLRLRHNPRTGKRDLVVEYESEEDLLPHEHERDHRRLVEQLLGRSLDDLGPIGDIRLEREPARGPGASEGERQAPGASEPTAVPRVAKPEPQG